jgi:hypothetical protein
VVPSSPDDDPSATVVPSELDEPPVNDVLSPPAPVLDPGSVAFPDEPDDPVADSEVIVVVPVGSVLLDSVPAVIVPALVEPSPVPESSAQAMVQMPKIPMISMSLRMIQPQDACVPAMPHARARADP